MRPEKTRRPAAGAPGSPGSDSDRRTAEPGYSDFDTVLNQRRELFPEEFPEGPYGAPEPEEG